MVLTNKSLKESAENYQSSRHTNLGSVPTLYIISCKGQLHNHFQYENIVSSQTGKINCDGLIQIDYLMEFRKTVDKNFWAYLFTDF